MQVLTRGFSLYSQPPYYRCRLLEQWTFVIFYFYYVSDCIFHVKIKLVKCPNGLISIISIFLFFECFRFWYRYYKNCTNTSSLYWSPNRNSTVTAKEEWKRKKHNLAIPYHILLEITSFRSCICAYFLWLQHNRCQVTVSKKISKEYSW